MYRALLLLSLCSLAISQCYYPDGTTADDNWPCNPGADNSVCCLSGTICTDNGICMDLGAGDSEFNRGSCTDKTWKDPACPTFCKESNANSFQQMASCSNSGAFVCQYNSSGCSPSSNRISIGIPVPYAIPSSGGASIITPSGIAITSSISGSPPTTTATTTTSASGSAAAVTGSPYGASPTSSPDSSSSGGLSDGAKIGIGVGVSLGVLFLVGAATAGFFLGRKRAGGYRRADNSAAPGQYQQYQGYHEMRPGPTAPGYQDGGSTGYARPGEPIGVPRSKPPVGAMQPGVPGYGYTSRAEAGDSQPRPELPDEPRRELQG